MNDLLNKMLESKGRLDKIISEGQKLHTASMDVAMESLKSLPDSEEKNLLSGELKKIISNKSQGDYIGSVQRIEALIKKINANR